MKLAEALNLLKQVCSGYKGTLQEHQILQQSLQVVETECLKKVTKEVEVQTDKDE